MKLLTKMKVGGPESTVTGYFLIEHKPTFSIVLLKFEGASREAYHSHAFNCISWVLKGELLELMWKPKQITRRHPASFKPFITKREDFHQVHSITKATWVLSFRGPWIDKWWERIRGNLQQLTHGRVLVSA